MDTKRILDYILIHNAINDTLIKYKENFDEGLHNLHYVKMNIVDKIFAELSCDISEAERRTEHVVNQSLLEDLLKDTAETTLKGVGTDTCINSSLFEGTEQPMPSWLQHAKECHETPASSNFSIASNEFQKCKEKFSDKNVQKKYKNYQIK